jgi:hypothetical protein
MSLRKIAAALTEAGHLNERGQPFNPKSIVAMVAQKTSQSQYQLGRVLINRQPNADLDAPPNVRYWA